MSIQYRGLFTEPFPADIEDYRRFYKSIKLSEKEMDENAIPLKIRGAIYKVLNFFGPGLLESVYVAALAAELKKE